MAIYYKRYYCPCCVALETRLQQRGMSVRGKSLRASTRVLAVSCAWRVTTWPDFELKGGVWLLPLLRGARDAASSRG